MLSREGSGLARDGGIQARLRDIQRAQLAAMPCAAPMLRGFALRAGNIPQDFLSHFSPTKVCLLDYLGPTFACSVRE